MSYRSRGLHLRLDDAGQRLRVLLDQRVRRGEALLVSEKVE